MLNNQVPLAVVHSEVEVCDGDLHSPVVLAVLLHVPVDFYGAHVGSALHKRLATPFARAINSRS